jgi:hypothetical protein
LAYANALYEREDFITKEPVRGNQFVQCAVGVESGVITEHPPLQIHTAATFFGVRQGDRAFATPSQLSADQSEAPADVFMFDVGIAQNDMGWPPLGVRPLREEPVDLGTDSIAVPFNAGVAHGGNYHMRSER